jgi:hypothetical protein
MAWTSTDPNCGTMAAVRTAALLLILAMMGPSVGALVCDWTCATKHERTSAGCHEHAGSESPTAIASVDVCHERVAALESVTTAQQTEQRAVLLSSAVPVDTRSSSLPSVIRSGSSNAPPLLLIPLRI